VCDFRKERKSQSRRFPEFIVLTSSTLVFVTQHLPIFVVENSVSEASSRRQLLLYFCTSTAWQIRTGCSLHNLFLVSEEISLQRYILHAIEFIGDGGGKILTGAASTKKVTPDVFQIEKNKSIREERVRTPTTYWKVCSSYRDSG